MSDPNIPPSDPSTPPPVTPPPPPLTPEYQSPPPTETNPQAKQWGMIAHLSGLVGLIGIPPIVGPLVVWLIKKNEFAFVDDQGKEAVNFHITTLIAALVLIPTICIGIGIVLLPLLGVYILVFSIVAAIKANDGTPYRYPATLRLIK